MTPKKYNAPARVAKGAAQLDELVPGWERRIDLGRLDMSSGEDSPNGACIVCQLTAAVFSDGVRKLRLMDSFSSGFISYANDPAEYRALDAAWRDLLKARFDSGVLSDGDA